MALDLTSIVGFRKVIVCLVGIIAISLSSDPSVMENITVIVGLYCGINILKAGQDSTREQLNKKQGGT